MTVSQLSRESRDDPPRHRAPGSETESCTSCGKLSRSVSLKPGGDGVWIGSIEAPDEHLMGTPLGVIKARALIALPDGQRFEAKAIDEMQGTPLRPSTKHPRSEHI